MADTLQKILQPAGGVRREPITAEPHFSIILDSPPSCIEFVPRSFAYPHHLVAGTYSLDSTDEPPDGESSSVQSRNGSLILIRLKDDSL